MHVAQIIFCLSRRVVEGGSVVGLVEEWILRRVVEDGEDRWIRWGRRARILQRTLNLKVCILFLVVAEVSAMLLGFYATWFGVGWSL